MKRNRLALCSEIPDHGPGKVPSELKCIPAPDAEGKVRGRDGRSWFFDQPELVLRNSPDRIAIDINHSTDLAAPRGEEAPAAGWINGRELELRDGAIWGKPRWNARGTAAVEGEEYAFISPVFDYDGAGRIVRLVRVSLTNNPNLDLALNAAVLDQDVDDYPPETLTMKNLLKELGLPETAGEAEALVALNSLKTQHQTALNAAQTPDLNKYVPRADYDAMQTRALNAEQSIADKARTDREKAADQELDAAQKAGKITPASREFYRATCMAEGGLEKFRDFLKSAPAIVEPGTTVSDELPTGQKTALNAQQKAVALSLGLSEEQFLKGAKQQ
ncbi:hypothetical protein ED208_12630 [Stagnimonas aquatica]|uniref:Mu-like prophage I protein n=1 Tax=Stagnimonas aquatica TaxID=2689987 RepID=A0A3N0V8I1_9GAMM|nr:phage protease [Stagnimonas aquatica]ROH88658.1 hypothetical protein ED208_12630 [Stagnimonas aquatica]